MLGKVYYTKNLNRIASTEVFRGATGTILALPHPN